jgi:hypothetical protein
LEDLKQKSKNLKLKFDQIQEENKRKKDDILNLKIEI